MTQQDIIQQLTERHEAFAQYLAALPSEDFTFSASDKWTPGQQLHHICLSVKPLNQALAMPVFMMQLLFGKANRPSRSYEEVVAKYALTLQKGGRASRPFIPPAVGIQQRPDLLARLGKAVHVLSARVSRYSEAELDALLLPHPLLGRMTLHEMLCFTIYHVQHHHTAIQAHLPRK